LHIDSSSIAHQISSNPEVRGKLTGVVDQTLKKADEVMNEGKRGTAVLAAFREKHRGEPVEASLKDPLPDLATCLDAQRWLSEHDSQANLSELADICHDQLADSLKQAQASLNDLKADLDRTGLHILTAGVPEKLTRRAVGQFFEDSYRDSSQLLGVTCTAFFLSLGAPFWYNALRQLASLKPPIAQKIKREESPSHRTAESW
jgi:hypothetical protein